MLGLSLGLSSARRAGVDALLSSMGLSDATDLLAIDFRSETMRIKDSATPANNFAGPVSSKMTYSSPSPKYRLKSNGLYSYETGIIYEYDTNGVNLGVPFEASRTNKLLRSQDFTASWALDHVGCSIPVVTPNYALAPDGTTTATRLQMDKTGGTFTRIQQTAAGTGAHVFSVWMKNNLSGTANVGLCCEGTGLNCAVTPTWQRFQLPWTAASVLSCQILLYDSIAGNDETADISIWGAQCETGSYATSYIPTTTAQVTRAVDNLSLDGSLFPLPSSGGMIVADWVPALGMPTAGIALINSASGGTEYTDIRSSASVGAYITSGGVPSSTFVGSDLRGTQNKAALRWKANSSRFASNGTLVGGHDTTVTLPTGLDRLVFALNGSASFQFYGTIRSLVIVPGTDFADADIIATSTL